MYVLCANGEALPTVPTHCYCNERKKFRDFFCRTIGVFPMRKVTDAGKHREIQVDESFAEPVGPRIGKQGIVLGPADAGRHGDLWQIGDFALHHRDAASIRGAVMGKAAGEVARLHEVVGEGIEHAVKGVFSVGPMPEKMSNVGFASAPCRADDRRCHFHLVERLVPDLLESIGFRHARADAGIDEIKEEQPDETIR